MTNKANKDKMLADYIKELSSRCQLDSWMQFVNEISIPPDLLPAMVTGRPELIKLMQPRALTTEEAKALFDIIGTLIATNMALKEHAEQLGQMVLHWGDAFKHLRSLGNRIERFATFEHGETFDEEEES